MFARIGTYFSRTLTLPNNKLWFWGMKLFFFTTNIWECVRSKLFIDIFCHSSLEAKHISCGNSFEKKNINHPTLISSSIEYSSIFLTLNQLFLPFSDKLLTHLLVSCSPISRVIKVLTLLFVWWNIVVRLQLDGKYRVRKITMCWTLLYKYWQCKVTLHQDYRDEFLFATCVHRKNVVKVASTGDQLRRKVDKSM